MKYCDNVFEGYLDPEEKFYDYRTSEVSGSKIFDEKTTGVSFYNQFLNSKDIEYLRDKKNLVAEIIQMSPNEYYEECGKYAFGHTISSDSLKSQRAGDKKTLDHLKQVLLVYKKRFPMPFINYAEKGQEGLHRMYVAGELFGWDSPKHPVLCIKWADEERHQREEHEKYVEKIESHIRSAVRDSLNYSYSSIEEFEGQLQYDLDNKFEYFDEIDKPVKFDLKVKDSTVYVTVSEVTYEFEKDTIKIQERTDEDDLDLDDMDLDLDLDFDEFMKKHFK